MSAFVGLELLSLPLYILCAALLRSERSLESGLKYLIIGSVGSATLLYGFALLYGATGTTDYGRIAAQLVEKGLAGDVLVLTGVGHDDRRASPSRRRWRRSTSGRPTSTRARRRR